MDNCTAYLSWHGEVDGAWRVLCEQQLSDAVEPARWSQRENGMVEDMLNQIHFVSYYSSCSMLQLHRITNDSPPELPTTLQHTLPYSCQTERERGQSEAEHHWLTIPNVGWTLGKWVKWLWNCTQNDVTLIGGPTVVTSEAHYQIWAASDCVW